MRLLLEELVKVHFVALICSEYKFSPCYIHLTNIFSQKCYSAKQMAFSFYISRSSLLSR